MAVEFGQRRFTSTRALEPGDLISFNYDGKRRLGLVIAPEYKENCDCFSYEELEEIPEEMLIYIEEANFRLQPGELWEVFGDRDKAYRSFKRDLMKLVQNVEFVTYSEDQLRITNEQESEEQ